MAAPFDASQNSPRRRKSDPHRRTQPAELAPTMSPASRYWLERSSEILGLPENKNPAASQSLHPLAARQTAVIENTPSGAVLVRVGCFKLRPTPSCARSPCILS